MFIESIRILLLILVIFAMQCLTAVPAQAQWVVTPHLGVNFAGDVELGKGGPGGSVGYFGRRIGFEFDFQRYQHFFKDSEVSPLDPAAPPNCVPGITEAGDPCTDINTDAIGFMGNVVVPIRIWGAARWSPYGTAGLGLIHAWTNVEDRHQNNLGFNGGGGVMYSLSKHMGLRGDLRYFRAVVDENQSRGVFFKDYGFWHTAIGVTFSFGRSK
jgi:opacity protein-like surface antigen